MNIGILMIMGIYGLKITSIIEWDCNGIWGSFASAQDDRALLGHKGGRREWAELTLSFLLHTLNPQSCHPERQ